MKYLDFQLSVSERANDLLGRMTLSEKIAQTRNLVAADVDYYSPCGNQAVLSDRLKTVLTHEDGVGALQCLTRCDFWTLRPVEAGFTTEVCRDAAEKTQKYAIENSRLGIPLLLYDDCRHGLPATNGTVFPTGIGQGANWNKELERKIGAAVAADMRSMGVRVSVGPNLNLAQDPRWSRMEECFGEEAYHAGSLGQAYVRGIQEQGDCAANVNFLCAMGNAAGGHDASYVSMGKSELHNVFKAFAMCAEARGAMASYGNIDGIPCHANPELTMKMWRQEAGFRGIIESDCQGVHALWDYLNIYPEQAHCSAAALKAGINMDLYLSAPPRYTLAAMQEAMDHNWITMDEIDAMVLEILETKIAMGLFEHPYPDSSVTLHSASNAALAVEAARQGTILLKNQGGVLPLSPEKEGKIALVGPHCSSAFHWTGDYTPYEPNLENQAESFKKNAPEDWDVAIAPGCTIRGDRDPDMLEEALKIARDADVIVVTLGGSSNRYTGNNAGEAGGAGDIAGDADGGEGLDKATLEISPAQHELFDELHLLGKPVIAVLLHGRPLCFQWILEQADAVLDMWYPGEGGGQALADAVWGRLNPGGRLPTSYPRHAGQLPVHIGLPRHTLREYTDMTGQPLLPFGYGLSYTTFTYESLELDKASMSADDECKATITLINSGDRTGDEVVQLYLCDVHSTRLRPFRELCGFERITLAPGERRSLSFTINKSHLEYYSAKNCVEVEPGIFRFSIGCPEIETLHADLEIR